MHCCNTVQGAQRLSLAPWGHEIVVMNHGQILPTLNSRLRSTPVLVYLESFTSVTPAFVDVPFPIQTQAGALDILNDQNAEIGMRSCTIK